MTQIGLPPPSGVHHWFGRTGVMQLAASQQRGVNGISATMYTMLAAYKQLDDIAFLLTLVPDDVLPDDELDRFMKITERHKKYLVASEFEVLKTHYQEPA